MENSEQNKAPSQEPHPDQVQQDQPQKDSSPAQPVDAGPDSASEVPPSQDPATPAPDEAQRASGQADEVDGSQDQQQDPSPSSPGDGSEPQS